MDNFPVINKRLRAGFMAQGDHTKLNQDKTKYSCPAKAEA